MRWKIAVLEDETKNAESLVWNTPVGAVSLLELPTRDGSAPFIRYCMEPYPTMIMEVS